MSISPLYVHELDELPEQNEETRQRFQIVDLPSLTWALRKMAAIKAKKEEINNLADAEIARIENFRKKEMDTLQGSEDFFQSLIGEYALKRRDQDPSFKSEKTPYGTIGFRKQQPKWVYEDQMLVAYLKENGQQELIRIKEEPVKTEIKKLFKTNDDGRVYDENGQAVEGIALEYLPDALDVKVEI